MEKRILENQTYYSTLSINKNQYVIIKKVLKVNDAFLMIEKTTFKNGKNEKHETKFISKELFTDCLKSGYIKAM